MHLDAIMKLTTGQDTSPGKKSVNEDSMGIYVPEEGLLTLKGAAAVIADGVSAAEAGREAAEICVQAFLNDYFSTPGTWSVETSVQKVLTATNRWLYGRGRQFVDSQRGYVSTLSALVLKSRTAHLFHVGDSRIYRLRNGKLEQLTQDHTTRIDDENTYLARAMGMDVKLDVDYRRVSIDQDDVFLLTTDGVHGYVPLSVLEQTLLEYCGRPQACCQRLIELAAEADSPDNLTCQVLCIDKLADAEADEVIRRLSTLPLPPPLSKGMKLDDYEVLKVLHESSRSHVYLVRDLESGRKLVLKAPSINYGDDPACLERFTMEQWIASRVTSLHVVRVVDPLRPRTFLYNLMEYVDGMTLQQWIAENPQPDVHEVVQIIRQVARGLMALHRCETLHQDLKPGNIMLTSDGTAKIIDMGSCWVAGIQEIAAPMERDLALGTLDYSAPEYRVGQQGDRRGDYFSLGCICYEMLTGKLPYGDDFDKAQGWNKMLALRYQPAYQINPLVPVWMDGALRKIVHVDRSKRYAELSEWMHDLEHPNPEYTQQRFLPLIDREPIRFWKSVSAMLALSLVAVLWAWLNSR